jgi:hypothetical protein
MTPYGEIFPGNKIDGHARAEAWDPRTYIRAAPQLKRAAPEGNELMASKSYLVVAAVVVASATITLTPTALRAHGWIFYDPYLQPPHYALRFCRVPWGRPWARRLVNAAN